MLRKRETCKVKRVCVNAISVARQHKGADVVEKGKIGLVVLKT